MKKKTIMAAVLSILVLAAGCGGQSSDLQNETTTQAAGVEEQKDVSVITGTIEDIKSFMFTIVDDNDEAYSMAFEEEPKGLSDVKNGDKVIVTYTGELTVVDAFTGTIVSIEKAN